MFKSNEGPAFQDGDLMTSHAHAHIQQCRKTQCRRLYVVNDKYSHKEICSKPGQPGVMSPVPVEIPHTLVVVIQSKTPQVCMEKGQSCMPRSCQQRRQVLQPCFAGPSPGDEGFRLGAGKSPLLPQLSQQLSFSLQSPSL
jgi:hypothetical protein